MRRILLGVSVALLAAGALLFVPEAARADGPYRSYYGRNYYRGGHGYRNYYRAPRYGYYSAPYRAPVYAPPAYGYAPSVGYPAAYPGYGYGYGYPSFSLGYQGRYFSFYYSR